MMLEKKNYLILLLLWGEPCGAEIYQWTDATGHTFYSDKKNTQASTFSLTKSQSYHTVKKVYDGDTILLIDGRKIRLLGINTPEIEHMNQPEQAGGQTARKWLTQQLLGKKVRLEFDQEKRDKYQRTLAHVFTEQGLHINHELVRLGLAHTSVFPPNLNYISELSSAEKQAEKQHLGIWHLAAYQIKQTAAITHKNKRGWQRIVGTVKSLKKTRKNTYLKLPNQFDVRIKKEHHLYFNDLSLLQGKKIEVRGWIHRYKKGFSMLIKHPTAMKILD